MKKSIVTIIFIIFFIILFGVVIYAKSNILIFNTNNKIEYGSKITIEDYISVSNGYKVDSCENLDTLSLGVHEVKCMVSKNTIKSNKLFTYEVVDTKAPIIEIDDVIEIKKDTLFNLKDYLSVYDDVDGNITDYKVNGVVNISKIDDYNLEIIAIDKNGLESKKDITVKIVYNDEESIIKVDL